MVKNFHNRNAIVDVKQKKSMKQDLSESTISFTCLKRMLCLSLALMNLLLRVALPYSSFVTVAVSIPLWFVKSDRLSPDADRPREDYYYEAPAFSRHTINLETMKPEKATEAPRNAGIDPSTMKMKQWYQGYDRVSDQKAPTGTDRASDHAREPIEDDDERLTMRQRDMPPPPPRIREDQAVQDFRQISSVTRPFSFFFFFF